MRYIILKCIIYPSDKMSIHIFYSRDTQVSIYLLLKKTFWTKMTKNSFHLIHVYPFFLIQKVIVSYK